MLYVVHCIMVAVIETTIANIPGRINQGNARALAMRSHEARRLRKLHQPLAPATVANIPLDAYQRRQLARVRQQLDKLSEKFDFILNESKIDAVAIEKMSRSIATFSDLERILSGRPLPGTNKPGTAKPQHAPIMAMPVISAEPIDIAPVPPEPEPLANPASP